MAEPKEPQSYGSEGDWSSGDVGQTVNRLKGPPNSQHSDFYESRREHDTEGGETSAVQREDRPHDPTASGPIEEPSKNVVTQPQGAKRSGFFKSRDYD